MTSKPKEEKEVWSACKCGAEREGDVRDNEQSICPDCKRIGCYTMTEPTPGAMRAAERITQTVIDGVGQSPFLGQVAEAVTLVARIIDQETCNTHDQLVDLVDLLRRFVPPIDREKDYWCPQCQELVTATFAEHCPDCGLFLTDVQPDTAWILTVHEALEKWDAQAALLAAQGAD